MWSVILDEDYKRKYNENKKDPWAQKKKRNFYQKYRFRQRTQMSLLPKKDVAKEVMPDVLQHYL
jgi:hypothetical protein